MRKGIGPWVIAGAALLAACESADDIVLLDAQRSWGPVAYDTRVHPRDTLGSLQARINGVPVEDFDLLFIDPVSFANARIRVELVAGSEVVETLVLDPAADAANCRYEGNPARIVHDLCGYEHGELRYSSILVQSESQGCLGDGLCLSRCAQPQQCRSGTKCGSSFASAELRYSHLDCVPAGPRTVGEVCAYSPGVDGRWVDDCAAGSICVHGICHAKCASDGDCPSGRTCTRIPGHSAELPACVANVLGP